MIKLNGGICALPSFIFLSYKLAATIERAFVLFGRTLSGGGAAEQRRVRLFCRAAFDWNEAAVHEDVVELNGLHAGRPPARRALGHVTGAVRHYSWASTSEWLRSTDDRALVLAREKILERAPRAAILGAAFGWKLGLRFFLEFARSYVLRAGFRDGVPGFVFCFFMAFSHALKFVKAYELAVAGEGVQRAP